MAGKKRKGPRAKSRTGSKAPKVKRARSGKRTPERPSRPVKRAAPPSRTARELARRDAAVEELGPRVKPGKVKLGGTRRLTPTKAGFRALRREVKAVRQAITRKGAKPRAYGFQLSIRYRGADGRFKKLEKVEGTFPLKRSLSKRKKKGESDAHVFERVTEDRIKAAVFRAIDKAEGIQGYTPAVLRALASGNRERITRAMQAFKKRRGVTFKVDVERHVTPGEAVAREKENAKRRARSRRKKAAAVRRGV